jgi:hypothetical protein
MSQINEYCRILRGVYVMTDMQRLKRTQELLQGYPVVLTREQAAEALNLRPRMVDQLRRKGILPATAANPTAIRKKSWRFNRVDIENHLLNTNNL